MRALAALLFGAAAARLVYRGFLFPVSGLIPTIKELADALIHETGLPSVTCEHLNILAADEMELIYLPKELYCSLPQRSLIYAIKKLIVFTPPPGDSIFDAFVANVETISGALEPASITAADLRLGQVLTLSSGTRNRIVTVGERIRTAGPLPSDHDSAGSLDGDGFAEQENSGDDDELSMSDLFNYGFEKPAKPSSRKTTGPIEIPTEKDTDTNPWAGFSYDSDHGDDNFF